VKRQYYFLASSLAELSLDFTERSDGSPLEALMTRLEDELHPQDYDSAKRLFLFNDLKNAVAFKKMDDPFAEPSYFSREEILDAAGGNESLAPYLDTYFENRRAGVRLYPDLPEIDELSVLLYEHVDTFTSRFVRDYFTFELNLRNAAIAVNMQQNGFPYQNRLLPLGGAYEQIIQGAPPDFGLTGDFPFVEKLIKEYRGQDLTAQERAVTEIRWHWLEERIGADFFSSQAIFAYVLRLAEIDRWQRMSEVAGDEILGELLAAVRRSVRFALEFAHIGSK